MILISILNTYDVMQAFRDHRRHRAIGLGTLIMLVNVVLLWAYSLSCHSCRHITGGRLKHFSKHPVRYWIWTQVSKLNARHMQLAWMTLGTLMLSPTCTSGCWRRTCSATCGSTTEAAWQ